MNPRLTKVFTAAFWLGLGLAIGVLLVNRGKNEVPINNHNPAPAAVQSRPLAVGGGRSAAKGSSTISTLEHLRVLAASPGNLILGASLQTISQLSLEECRDAVSLFTTYPDHERTVLWKAIARRWAELDLAHAFRTAIRENHNPIRNHLGLVSAEGLAARDPESALREISAAKGKYNKITIANWVIPALAKADPQRAAEFLGAEKMFNGFDNLYREVARNYVRASPDEALRWTRSLPTENLREESFTEAWRTWSDTDPMAAAAAVNTASDDKTRPHLYGAIAHSWSAKDPTAALAWIQSLPDGPAKNEAFKTFRIDLAHVHPGEAREVIESLLPELQKNLAWQVATQLARDNVKDALTWVESLSGTEARSEALNKIMEVWSPTEPAEAAAYMAALPESQQRTELIKRAASLWSSMEPEAALDWAKQLPSARDRDHALGEVVQAIREDDPEKAMATLSLINDEATRGRVAGNVLESYARIDGPGAAAWAQSLPEKLQAEALGGVIRTWGRENHNDAGDWVKTLPPGEARDSAIAAYVSVIDGTDAEMATQWATSINDPVKRTEAMFEAFQRWAQENPPAAGEWLENADLAEGFRPFFDKLVEEGKSRKAGSD